MKGRAWFVCVVAVVAGCAGDDDYPIIPGSPTTGGGGAESGEPGGPGGGIDTGFIEGRVCRATTLLDLRLCSANAGGLNVSLGGVSTITGADGSFLLPRPSGSFLSFQVSGQNAITTTTPFSPSLTVPVIDADVFARALTSNSIFLPEGTGSILGTVIRGTGTPAAGITVRTSPLSPFGPFFDGTDPAIFRIDGSGPRGVFFVPGLTTGANDLTFVDATTGGETLVSGISVVNGGVTILDSVLIP